VSQPKRLSNTARNGCLMLGLVIVFLTVGVPRWLTGDVAPPPSHADANFSRLCRDRGGTLRTMPGSGARKAQRFCTVRYGRHVYRMDAITRDGFDQDTAHYQRLGCTEARREQNASTTHGDRQRSFIYHPATGVCEHRP